MTRRRGSRAILLTAMAVAAAGGCRKMGGDEESGQIGAAVGEAMSSLDESVAGETTAMLPFRRMPDELKGSFWQRAKDRVIPYAYAATCWEPVFGACDAGVRTKDFAGCTIGPATVTGTVTLTFTRALCLVATTGDAVTRVADFSVTGLYGGSLAVSSPGGGQTLTKTDVGFDFTVGGMERILTLPSGRKLFDVATHTTAHRLRTRRQSRGTSAVIPQLSCWRFCYDQSSTNHELADCFRACQVIKKIFPL